MSCCTEFAKAQERGTDNEEYGALFYFDKGVHRAGVDSWRVGGDSLAAPKYCPWCAAALRDQQPIDAAAEPPA